MGAATTGAAYVKASTAAPAPTVAGDKRIDMINFDLLEEEAKKIMSPGAYAFTSLLGFEGTAQTANEDRELQRQ